MIIKVCGMRQAENIAEVEQLQPDMMGFICWQQSKRALSETPTYLPNVCRVGVFVDPNIQEVKEWSLNLSLSRIQLHGHESRDFCHRLYEELGLPITKALSISTTFDLEQYHEYVFEPSVDLFLFDTKCTSVGGSGKHFDWDILHQYNGSKPFLLAGGIGPEDADRVKAFVHPRCVGIDLNSRFEITPGIKDTCQLRTFIKNMRS